MMRRSSSKSSIPIASVLKPRNNCMTPSASSSRLSAVSSKFKQSETKNKVKPSSARKERPSVEKLHRISLASAKLTPSKFATPNQGRNALVHPVDSRLSTDTIRSSFGGKSGSKSWPISDPSFKTQCIDTILEFLSNNRFDFTISRNVLRSPKKTDFVMIFNFIYGHIVKGFTLTNRIEDEIPKLLKSMKYPIQLQKSVFLNVGSPHTWPSVLAMLSYLVNVVYSCNVFNGSEVLLPESDFGNENDIQENRLSCILAQYGGGDGNEILMAYKENWEKTQKLTDDDLYAVEREEQQLTRKLEDMGLGREKVLFSEQQKAEIMEDREKILNFNDNIENHISAKDAYRAQEEINLENLKEIFQEIDNEIKRLKEKKLYQNYSIFEIGRLKKHKEEVTLQLAHLDSEKKHLNEQLWSTEMEVGKIRTRVGEEVLKYNYKCEELHDVKITLPNSEEELTTWVKEIVPVLKEAKKNQKSCTFNNRNTLTSCGMEKEKVMQMVQSSERELHKLNCKHKRLQDENSCLKKEIVEEEEILHKELEEMGEIVAQERRIPKSSLYEKQRLLEETKNKNIIQTEKTEETKLECIKLCFEEQKRVIELLTSRREIVKTFQERQNEKIKNWIDKLER